MSNIATPMPQIRARFTSKLGIPLSGCKVYTYEPNSNIPKTTWIDIDKTVENTNPILLDAAGEADIFLDGLYQIVVKDRFGFTVYDVEKTGYEQPIFNDSLLLTWSGRTQEAKNKENPSPLDFGAVGNSVANDTQAFNDLEVEYQGQIIDLLGKTYLADKTPYANKYINGNFLVGTSLIPANGKQFSIAPLDAPLQTIAFDSTSGLMWSWYNTSAFLVGADANAVQSIAFDEKNRHIYAIQETGAYDTSSVLYRHPMDRGIQLDTPLWGADADRRVGHQGLAVENHRNGQTYIWASKRNNTGHVNSTDVNAGCKVIRFPIVGVPTFSDVDGAVNDWPAKNGFYFENVEVYQLWETEITGQNTQATISHDQKYLLTKMNTATGHRIRVFLLETLVSGGAGNYSNKFIQEFSVIGEGYEPINGVGLQGMASDGKNIYFYSGRGDVSQGAVLNLQVFTMYGEFVDRLNIADVGLYDSVNYYRSNNAALGTISETECINFVTINGKPHLTIQFAAGTAGQRPTLIYALGLKQGNFRGDRNIPALVLGNAQDGLSLGFGSRKKEYIGAIGAGGAQTKNFSFIDGRVVAGADTGAVELLGIGSAGRTGFSTVGNHNAWRGSASATPVRHSFYRTRSETYSSSVALQDSDYISEIATYVDDGAQNYAGTVGLQVSNILTRVTGPVSAGVVPTTMFIETMQTTGLMGKGLQIKPTGAVSPLGLTTLGDATDKWQTIYATTATINTSDEREKVQIQDLSEIENQVSIALKPLVKKFKMKDAVEEKGDDARWHFGFIAQEVAAVFEAHGLNPFAYAFICFDEWDEAEAIVYEDEAQYDDDGKLLRAAESRIISAYRPAGNRYGLRYEELICFIIANL